MSVCRVRYRARMGAGRLGRQASTNGPEDARSMDNEQKGDVAADSWQQTRQQWIESLNIKRFREHLEVTTDPGRRAILLSLIEEHLSRLAPRPSAEAPGATAGRMRPDGIATSAGRLAERAETTTSATTALHSRPLPSGDDVEVSRELNRLLNDPEIPLDPARIWSLVADLARGLPSPSDPPGNRPDAPSAAETACRGEGGGVSPPAACGNSPRGGWTSTEA